MKLPIITSVHDTSKYPYWKGPVINNGMLCINKKGDAVYRIMDYNRESGDIDVFNIIKQRAESIHRNSIGITIHIDNDKYLDKLFHIIKDMVVPKLSWSSYWYMCLNGKSPS